MSLLRPEVQPTARDLPCPRNGTAYLLILNAVKSQDGLIHGKLDDGNRHCAIGSYFAAHDTKLESDLIDEVALVNDSVPDATPRQRKLQVIRWLKWKLASLGFPGMKAPKRLRKEGSKCP